MAILCIGSRSHLALRVLNVSSLDEKRERGKKLVRGSGVLMTTVLMFLFSDLSIATPEVSFCGVNFPTSHSSN